MVRVATRARGNVSGFNPEKPPFIVTASLPDDIFAWANRLRTEHFPPERNFLKAHVTLFHSLASNLFEELKTVLPRFAADAAPPAARLTGLLNFGKGTAIAIKSPGMLAVRERIAEHFHGALTAQDLHEPRLHITVQNKVSKEAAQALQQQLDGTFELKEFAFPGLELHIYRGGPWEHVQSWRFRGRG